MLEKKGVCPQNVHMFDAVVLKSAFLLIPCVFGSSAVRAVSEWISGNGEQYRTQGAQTGLSTATASTSVQKRPGCLLLCRKFGWLAQGIPAAQHHARSIGRHSSVPAYGRPLGGENGVVGGGCSVCMDYDTRSVQSELAPHWNWQTSFVLVIAE